MKYRCWEAFAGWNTPQLQIQFTPLAWGFGGGIGSAKAALRLGPVAIAVWYGPTAWKAEAR